MSNIGEKLAKQSASTGVKDSCTQLDRVSESYSFPAPRGQGETRVVVCFGNITDFCQSCSIRPGPGEENMFLFIEAKNGQITKAKS